jgi:hypothetical protein
MTTSSVGAGNARDALDHSKACFCFRKLEGRCNEIPGGAAIYLGES